MNSADTRAVVARITGRVQGVCFRASTRDEAALLGLRGWVRNQSDGSVEACFIGPPDDVEAMLSWCRRGPTLARVRDVQVREESVPEDLPDGFRVRF